LQPNRSNPSSQDSVAAGLAEMAQRDLDAALQLLADRAQYITGATGAAIALRRDGRNDMLCRASTGPNAPELGALLSTEFGLSGESVRTKQLLRCDDAELDARVNREVCQKLGIASVVVMPVVNDDEVLGVFELFSGKTNAFGERDVSAVQRLSEMVETAVRLAQATVTLPEKLKNSESAAADVASAAAPAIQDDPSDHILDEEIFAEPLVQVQKPVVEIPADSVGAAPSQANTAPPTAPHVELPTAEILPKRVADPVATAKATAAPEPVPSPQAAAPAKKLFWSAAVAAGTDSEKPAEADQSHIPPMLRALRKCEACGFPITAERVLCVECEEKKWRGQLKRPPAADRPVEAAAVKSAVSGKVEGQAFAAAAHAVAKTSSAAVPSQSGSVDMPVRVAPPRAETQKIEVAALPAAETAKLATREVPVEPLRQSSEPSTPVVFSGGLGTSQSWFSANKYIIAVLLLVAAAVAAFFLMR
jgi:predicted secreted protein